jgi:glycine/D-amino acid oxidase-like deaminating enzyme
MSVYKPQSSYDPLYDPLTASNPGRGRAYAPTYWIDTAPPAPAADGPLTQDTTADVVIIGSGYTGLSCAIHLAREHGLHAMVLEANGVSFGCSTRNGGQAQISTGRLKRSQWIERWGLDVAQGLHREVSEAFELFRSLLKEPLIQCDPQDGGHLYIAHRQRNFATIQKESALLNEIFHYPTQVLSKAQVLEQHVHDHETVGAVWEPDGIGIHAAKLAFGYESLARSLGARIHHSSPVTQIEKDGATFRVITPGGVVRTKAVAIATAGYTPPNLHPLTRHRLFPVLSNSMVTRVLTPAERAECGFKSQAFYTDTRTLRHYYRLMPDGRVQIGSRSSITGADAAAPLHLNRLKAALARKFPSLTDIEIDYSWWGWVDVGHDLMPRIVQPDPAQRLYYSLAYGGNGVMYSAQAGRRLAQLVAGQALPALPIFQSTLPTEGLLTHFRRLGQRLLYGWYYRQDEAPD